MRTGDLVQKLSARSLANDIVLNTGAPAVTHCKHTGIADVAMLAEFLEILQLYGDQRSVTRAAFAMRSSSLQYTPGAPWQALCNRSGLQARASPDEEPSSLRTSAPVTRVRRHSGEENCVTTSHSGARRVVSKTSTTRLLATLYGWGWNAHGGIVGTAEAHRTGLGRWGSPRGRHASLHIVTRQQWKQTTPLATLKLLICEF